ncbi:uncharacterized protein LOC118648865 [Monomorium pharaonis]|uniref:uncharacterized protein LOC118648865 n=1 Tax=Monomorium pharaonis TaxID=307658 RepID=UPI001747C969|nr:uncharacterized protein LOC118648865 [Monomorium pharaonis]
MLISGLYKISTFDRTLLWCSRCSRIQRCAYIGATGSHRSLATRYISLLTPAAAVPLESSSRSLVRERMLTRSLSCYFFSVYISRVASFPLKDTSICSIHVHHCIGTLNDFVAANRTELPSQRLLHMWTSPSRLRIGRAPRKKTQP